MNVHVVGYAECKCQRRLRNADPPCEACCGTGRVPIPLTEVISGLRFRQKQLRKSEWNG